MRVGFMAIGWLVVMWRQLMRREPAHRHRRMGVAFLDMHARRISIVEQVHRLPAKERAIAACRVPVCNYATEY